MEDNKTPAGTGGPQGLTFVVGYGLAVRERWQCTVKMAISPERLPSGLIFLPKVVNEVVNWGVKLVNCTCQSCESWFPPTEKSWIDGEVVVCKTGKVGGRLLGDECLEANLISSWGIFDTPAALYTKYTWLCYEAVLSYARPQVHQPPKAMSVASDDADHLLYEE